MKTLVGFLVGVVLALGGSLYYVNSHLALQQTPGSGSITGPDSLNPYESVGGLQTWSTNKKLATATTTVCSVRSPVAATSTLVFAGVKFLTSTTTAFTVYFGKATNPTATTTALGQAAIAANAQGTVLASTTVNGGTDPAQVFAPGTYFNVAMTGGTGTFSPVGTCDTVFKVN